MADILIKDNNGILKAYKGIKQVEFPTTDGGIATYTEGNGGSGSCVIEVTEFPTENVQDETIYKTTYRTSSEIYFNIVGFGIMTMSQAINTMVGIEPSIYYYEVEELPSDMRLSNMDTFEIHIYIANDDFGYVSVDLGEGATTLTVGEFLESEDKGAVNSIEDITEEGIYVLRGQEVTELGGKDINYIYTNNEWINYYEQLKQFFNRTITSMTIPNGVHELPAYTFSMCFSLKEINLSKVKTISRATFNMCMNLPRIDLPSVYFIREEAFFNCFKLKTVIIRQTEEICELGSKAFTGCHHIEGTQHDDYNPTGAKDGFIYVPDSLVDSYKSATNWSAYASQIKPLSEYVEE